MNRRLRVLFLTAEPRAADAALDELGRAGLRPEEARADTEAAFTAALSPRLDLILADLALEGCDPERALTRLAATGLDTPVIVIGAALVPERTAALRARGAYAVLAPARLGDLGEVAERALQEARLRRENRRLHERLLLEQRAREAVEESMPAGLLCFDRHGKVSRVNRTACAMLGYTAEELVGMAAPYPFWPAGAPPLCGPALREGRATCALETTALRRVGTEFPVLLHVSPLCALSGASEGWVALLCDVSEMRALRSESEFRRALLEAEHEATLDGVLVVDADGGVVSTNRRFGELWGLPPALLAQRRDAPMLEAALPLVRDPEAFLTRVRYLYEHPQETARDDIALKDGRVLERYSAPLTAPDGRHLGRAWFFREREAAVPHA